MYNFFIQKVFNDRRKRGDEFDTRFEKYCKQLEDKNDDKQKKIKKRKITENIKEHSKPPCMNKDILQKKLMERRSKKKKPTPEVTYSSSSEDEVTTLMNLSKGVQNDSTNSVDSQESDHTKNGNDIESDDDKSNSDKDSQSSESNINNEEDSLSSENNDIEP